MVIKVSIYVIDVKNVNPFFQKRLLFRASKPGQKHVYFNPCDKILLSHESMIEVSYFFQF